MSDYNSHAEFIESLYKMSNEELKELYKLLKKNKDEVSQKIADILYKYTINDGVMDIKNIDRVKLYNELSKTITTTTNSVGVTEVVLTEKVLEIVIEETFKFWNYNINYEDVRKLIKNNFKGKHFSDRVWENEEQVAKRFHKLTHDFLDGKVNVNQIKREIEKLFNASEYNAKRLVETEISRVHDEAFKKLCEEMEVKKIRRNAILDTGTCDDCKEDDGTIYELDKAPELPAHPLCRCFFDIVE